jgi:hypothetical protein
MRVLFKWMLFLALDLSKNRTTAGTATNGKMWHGCQLNATVTAMWFHVFGFLPEFLL